MGEYGAGWWRQFQGWLDTSLFSIGTSPVSVSGLLRVMLIVAVAWILSRIVRSAIDRIGGHWSGMHRASLYTLGRVVHYLLLALGILIGLATIGVDFSSLALILGALGVGIGFGLQNMVANFVAGIGILFERHLKVGDFVELESGVTGEVREIRMRATRITTNDNIDILVPNSEFVNGRVINWTLDEAFRRIHVPFGVAYGSSKEKVRTVVLEAADHVPYTLKGIDGRAPQVWFVKFGDSSLDFELVVWLTPEAVKRPSAVQAAYLWEIHNALEQNGIEIPFPQRDLHVRSVLGMKGDAARAWIDQRGVTSPDQEKQ